MGFATLKSFAMLQLLLLMLDSFNSAETLTKAHPPASSPSHEHYSHPPSDQPSNHPPSKPVDVEGMVYCKECNHSMTPISGAVVKLKCHHTKHVKNITATTDHNGYFLLKAPHTVATYGVYKCIVYLLSSPLSSCQVKTDLNNGITGATVKYEEQSTYALYAVGPFAFEPSKC